MKVPTTLPVSDAVFPAPRAFSREYQSQNLWIRVSTSMYRPLGPNMKGRWLIPWVFPISTDRRLAEMEHEIGMVKATQRQMQTMLGEILNELRRGSGRPLPSSATEGPTVCSCTAGVVLPVAAQTSPVLMSSKHV